MKETVNNHVLQILSFTADKTVELADANSVVGDAIEKDGVSVIPVSSVSVGFAGGGADTESGKRAAHPVGAGGKVDRKPTAFLVFDKDGVTVKSPAASASKPDLMGLVKNLFKPKK
ncbi:MAG: hypothetical protein IKY33_02235 [Clostridia bacterium]|nr:hypothetical protein [Clostridia bacterium]